MRVEAWKWKQGQALQSTVCYDTSEMGERPWPTDILHIFWGLPQLGLRCWRHPPPRQENCDGGIP